MGGHAAAYPHELGRSRRRRAQRGALSEDANAVLWPTPSPVLCHLFFFFFWHIHTPRWLSFVVLHISIRLLYSLLHTYLLLYRIPQRMLNYLPYIDHPSSHIFPLILSQVIKNNSLCRSQIRNYVHTHHLYNLFFTRNATSLFWKTFGYMSSITGFSALAQGRAGPPKSSSYPKENRVVKGSCIDECGVMIFLIVECRCNSACNKIERFD
jgi:hypothetical protein